MTVESTLSIVIPVYNEEKNIEALLRDWSALFTELKIAHQFIVVDDGSRDNSLEKLKSLQSSIAGIRIISQPNAGHGPAILRGYHAALEQPEAQSTVGRQTVPPPQSTVGTLLAPVGPQAGSSPQSTVAPQGVPSPQSPACLSVPSEWIFQIDSDHQFDPDAFKTLWQHKDQFDFLLAERIEKTATLARRFVSLVSKITVHTLFGRGRATALNPAGTVSTVTSPVADVNSPYRLMRSAAVSTALTTIPPGAFAPNILLTAWFIRKKSRTFTTKVDTRKDISPRKSGMNAYFIRGCIKSIFQTIQFRTRL